MNKLLPIHIILLLLLIPALTAGQSLDSIRQIAWEGQYEEARELCLQRDDYPQNTDVLFLTGQTYLWEGSPQKAEKVFKDVLKNNPRHIEAIVALTSISMERENYPEFIEQTNKGLEQNTDNEDLIYHKAFAHARLNRIKAARAEIDRLLRINPEHEKGLELKESLGYFKIPGSISLYQSAHWFDTPYEQIFFTTTVEAPIGDQSIKIIPRFNFGSLNTPEDEISGSQAGIDIYPLTGNASYLYLHYAYSDADIFPAHRGALEWFTAIGNGWEISGGGRFLRWNENQYFFTSSVSKYMGKWMPGLRFFYAPESDNDVTALASIRKYFNDSRSYLHLYMSYGANPDRSERQIDFATTVKTTRLTSGAYSIFKITGPFYARLAAEYNIEEYIQEEWRNAFLLQAGIEYKF